MDNGANKDMQEKVHIWQYYCEATFIDHSACLPQKGRTGLSIAAYHGKEDVVKLMVNKGANINLQDNVCFT